MLVTLEIDWFCPAFYEGERAGQRRIVVIDESTPLVVSSHVIEINDRNPRI
jgi:hypothetical protein